MNEVKELFIEGWQLKQGNIVLLNRPHKSQVYMEMQRRKKIR
jgi:hypothetical protein